MHRKTALTSAVTISALTLGTLFAGLTPATAGPDDGKIVTTKGHVDAPKTFWENDIFTLKNESNYRGQGPETVDLEKTVNWVGKGWGGSIFSKGNQYIFTSTGSEALSFLGGAGKHYYLAPQLTSYNHDPIWAGFGADSDIPVEKFRDGTFSLDILSVDGPGVMEFFSYSDFGTVPSALRMLSSQENGLQSYLLAQGTHTHNNTVFSKPGRYEVTYRTVARSADGTESIASRPTKLAWQVGGQKPISGDGTPTGMSTEDRYAAAPVGNLAEAGYSLSLAPHEGRDNDGDDKLTDITFTSTSAQEGTLTLYNNGYFLTDLTVSDGTASWSEMLGSEASEIQAVFTPEAGQDGARWVSPALHYTFGSSDRTSSAAGEGDWPTKISDPRNSVLKTGFYTPTSGNYTATLKPAPEHMEGYALIEVKFDDPNFRGFIRGGLYAERGEEYPQARFEANIIDGVARQYIRASEYSNGTFPKVEVVPHPDMNALRSAQELDGSYVSGQSVHTAQGQLEITSAPTELPPAPTPAPSEPTPVPTPEPSTPAEPAPVQPTPTPSVTPQEPSTGQQCLYSPYEGRSIIGSGHVDIQAKLQDGALGISLKDDSGAITSQSQQRSLNDVVFTVGENAKHQRSGSMMVPELDFIGEEGAEFYGLPQTQMEGIVWPGYNTEHIDYSQLEGPVTLHLEPKTMPENAQVGVYEERLNGVSVFFDSQAGDTRHEIPFATHAHANWVFTKAGHYTFDAYYTAQLKDGTELKSPVEQLAFAVGKQAVADCEEAVATPEASPSVSAPADQVPIPSVAPSSSPAPTEPAAPSSSATGAPSPVSNYSPGAQVSQAPVASPTSAPASSAPASEGSEAAHSATGSTYSPGTTSAHHAQGGSGVTAPAEKPQTPAAQPALAHTGVAALPLGFIALTALASGTGMILARRRSRG